MTTTTHPAVLREGTVEQALVLSTVALSVFDAGMTLHWIGLGVAEELNPLMAMLIDAHPALFLLGKLSLLVPAVSLLYVLRQRWTAALSLRLAFLGHVLLAAYHLGLGR